MHAHKHVRKRVHVRRRLGVAAVALATTIIATPQAHAAPVARTQTVEAVVAKKSKRHWGRYWGWSRPWHRTPTAVEIVLATARAQLGKPYVYGSAGPNTFDCSGLTMFVWAAAGVALPHNAAAQDGVVRHVGRTQLRPGDLVFFGHRYIGHVGIYIGGGKMIHAPYSGARVRVEPLQSDLAGAGRPSR